MTMTRTLTKFGAVVWIDEEPMQVEGYVYGLLGVHKPVGSASADALDVTHIPTGRRVIRLYKEADAVQLFCERLQAVVDLDTSDVDEAWARVKAWMGESKSALMDLADECGPDLEERLQAVVDLDTSDDEEDDDEDDDEDEDDCYNCDNLRDRLYDTRRDRANLRRELLALSETLSATTIMATARRLRELGDGA